MKHIITLVLLLLIATAQLSAQYPPIPDNPQMDKAANVRMQKNTKEILIDLQSNDIHFIHKSVLHGWNLFIQYCKVYPDNHQIIRDVFLIRLSYEPVGFCENYKERFKTNFKKDDRFWKIYKQEVDFMDSMCDCVISQKDNNLIKTLIAIEAGDQKHKDADALKNDKSIQEEQKALDSMNLLKVERIIKFHGYPGRSLVGTEYENIAWTILLHADEKVIKKYIGLIKQEIKNRNLHPSAYAYMYDRLAILQDKPQRFGTQSQLDEQTNEMKIYKCEDPDKVNYYRYSSCMPGLKEFPKSDLFDNEQVREGTGK